MKNRDIEEMRRLRRSGLTFDQISDKTQYSHNTVNKYCKGIKRGNGQAGKALIEVTSNPLLAIQDLNEMMQGAMATGVSIGSGIEAVHRSFADESLSKEERMGLAMKGGAYLTGIISGTIMTLQDLAKVNASETAKIIDEEKKEEVKGETKEESEEKNKSIPYAEVESADMFLRNFLSEFDVKDSFCHVMCI
ncbi:unnamed protein product [marine sediment metagenome]|uniref:Uncharacterized protein n=1 Tax=marine sediment metagenome TaxID=412755 RepID=X1TXX0_9ZZZZ